MTKHYNVIEPKTAPQTLEQLRLDVQTRLMAIKTIEGRAAVIGMIQRILGQEIKVASMDENACIQVLAGTKQPQTLEQLQANVKAKLIAVKGRDGLDTVWPLISEVIGQSLKPGEMNESECIQMLESGKLQ